MRDDAVKTSVLSIQIIPNAEPALLKRMGASEGMRSLGIFTTDCDDVSYAALDEATKRAAVNVLYAKSMYAGSSNASTSLAGEFVGVLEAADPEAVRSGIEAAVDFISGDACFYSANDDDSIVYFAHCISRTGTYLSNLANVPEGTAMAYLIAPPLEAVCGVDEALKAAKVKLSVFFGPPTETNFAGALLTGEQAACAAACDAFAATVKKIAADPKIL